MGLGVKEAENHWFRTNKKTSSECISNFTFPLDNLYLNVLLWSDYYLVKFRLEKEKRLWNFTKCTAWSISSVVTPGFTIMAEMSRTSRASWRKQTLSLYLQIQMSFMHLCSWNFNCCISVIILYTKLSCVIMMLVYLADNSHALNLFSIEDLNLRRPFHGLLWLWHSCKQWWIGELVSSKIHRYPSTHKSILLSLKYMD